MKILRTVLFAAALGVAGCASDPSPYEVRDDGYMSLVAVEFREPGGTEVLAITKSRLHLESLTGRSGENVGVVVVNPGPHGMVIRIGAKPIEPNGFHGVHLHQVGDCSDPEAGFKASGGHIGAGEAEHGLLNPKGYHVGADFPNVWASDAGITAELFAAGLTFEEALDEDGFALIIHENPDDHISQPIGGAGARIACAAFFPEL